jgi:hypothetical protein
MEKPEKPTPDERVRSALAGLLDWAREQTSPRDANSPHDLLVEAAAALDAVNVGAPLAQVLPVKFYQVKVTRAFLRYEAATTCILASDADTAQKAMKEAVRLGGVNWLREAGEDESYTDWDVTGPDANHSWRED